MEKSQKTAREIYLELKSNLARKRFGFGKKAILVNVDLQKAYTRTDLFYTAYETDPNQLNYVNQLAERFRIRDWPISNSKPLSKLINIIQLIWISLISCIK